MQKEKITLTLDEENNVFYGSFTDISKDLLQRLKNNEFALKKEERIKHIVVDLFPDTVSGDILIEIADPDDETYDVDIYFDPIATKEMKDPVTKWNNRDIDLNEDDESLEIRFTTRKDSPIIQKNDENEIILEL